MDRRGGTEEGSGTGGARNDAPQQAQSTAQVGGAPAGKSHACSICGAHGHKAPTCPRRPNENRPFPRPAPPPKQPQPEPSPGTGQKPDRDLLLRMMEPLFCVIEETIEAELIADGGKGFPRTRIAGEDVRVVARLNASLWVDVMIAFELPANKYLLLASACATTGTSYVLPAYRLSRRKRDGNTDPSPNRVVADAVGDEDRRQEKPQGLAAA